MPGGENFERKPLNFSGTTLTRSEVKKHINDFKRNYFKYARLLSDKAEMEKKGLSDAYEFYCECCEKWNVDKCLASLYKIVASTPWLTDDDCVDLIRAREADPKGQRNDFSSYADVFQNILSNIEKHIGSFGDVTGGITNKQTALGASIMFLRRDIVDLDVTQDIEDYLECAFDTAKYLKHIVDTCEHLGLTK